MLEPRISGCHYYFLLIVASGLTRWCGSSVFLISFPRHSSGTCPVKLRTCWKDLSASRSFLRLIIGGFRLLINASLSSWISCKACLLTPWNYSAQVEWLGASLPPFFPAPGNVCAIYCGSRQTLFYPTASHFPILLLSGSSLWWFWVLQLGYFSYSVGWCFSSLW